jgi:hypothetical protein
MTKLPVNNSHLSLEVMSFTEVEEHGNSHSDSVDDEFEPVDKGMFICMDCEVDTKQIREYFMVTNRIWMEYVPERRGFLCLGCLEARMGRTLESKDFPSYLPINNPKGLFFPHSDRLMARLTTG